MKKLFQLFIHVLKNQVFPLFLLVVLGTELRAIFMLSNCSFTRLCPESFLYFLLIGDRVSLGCRNWPSTPPVANAILGLGILLPQPPE